VPRDNDSETVRWSGPPDPTHGRSPQSDGRRSFSPEKVAEAMSLPRETFTRHGGADPTTRVCGSGYRRRDNQRSRQSLQSTAFEATPWCAYLRFHQTSMNILIGEGHESLEIPKKPECVGHDRSGRSRFGR
jgi:hypothetical protein